MKVTCAETAEKNNIKLVWKNVAPWWVVQVILILHAKIPQFT